MHSCARPHRTTRNAHTQPCALSFATVMCILHAETLSESHEEELHQHIFDAFLDMFTSFQLGDGLEAYLTEGEEGGVGLSCHKMPLQGLVPFVTGCLLVLISRALCNRVCFSVLQ